MVYGGQGASREAANSQNPLDFSGPEAVREDVSSINPRGGAVEERRRFLFRRQKKGIWLLPFLLIFTVNGLSEQRRPFPFALKNQDLWMFPLGIGLSKLGDSICDSYNPISIEEILALDRKDVFVLDRCATHNWSMEWNDRSDLYQDIIILSTLSMLTIPPLFHAKLKETFTVSVMIAESYFFLRGITYITKGLVGRKRPYLYNTSLSAEERQGINYDSAYFSFFSGHAAAAFMGATLLSKVISDIHGPSVWTKILWGSSLSVAAMTAYARVKAGVHYPTDVIVGAGVGFAIGYLIPVLHKKNRESGVSVSAGTNFMSLSIRF